MTGRRILVDVEATKAVVGQVKAYQWQKEWKECGYSGYQDEGNPLVFRVNVWQDYMVEVVLDEKHPGKPPRFGASIPRMDAETTLLLKRMECLDPKKWNFCTKLEDVLRFAEAVVRRGKPTEEWRPLEEALFELGDVLDAQPKCIEDIPGECVPELPKFGEAEDEEKATKKRKLTSVGWSLGTGYGAGSLNGAVSAPTPTPSKADETYGKLADVVEQIGRHLTEADVPYVKSVSTWQRAIQPFVASASLFDFEKYESLFAKIEAIARRLGDARTLSLLQRRRPGDDRAPTTGIEAKTEYQRLLAPEHVLQCSMTVPTRPIPGGNAAAAAGPPSAALVRRAVREFHTLIEGLPLLDDTAIFARHNTDNLLHFKLMIVPSNETPYAYGCYCFSVLLPADYPSSPPSVLFETTDGDTVRFNPNLYNNGKVCLSLIGTWPGRPEETWDPDNSNILALALSIQALIFTPEPYFNEPGYEAKRGTPEGEHQKLHYNATVRANNKRVAIDNQYANPPPEFASVIRKHLDYHRAAIDLAFADVNLTLRTTTPPDPHDEPPPFLIDDDFDDDDDDDT